MNELLKDVLTHNNLRKKYFFLFACGSVIFLEFFFLPQSIIEKSFINILLNSFMLANVVLGLIGYFIIKEKMFFPTIVLGVIALNISVAVSGDRNIILWLLASPILFFSFFKKMYGMSFAMIQLLVLYALILFPGTEQYNVNFGSRIIAVYFFIMMSSHGLEVSRQKFEDIALAANKRLLDKQKKLEEALENVKQLNGLLPICSSCKQIRDDNGYWSQVESYISEHTDAQFSHGLCPKCAKKLYGELIDDEE